MHEPTKIDRRRLLNLTGGLATAWAMAGCAGQPDALRAQTRAAAPSLSVSRFEVAGRRLQLTVAVAAPTGGRRPVVVYLPGLGQDCEAGQRWQAAWALAGYAVVSLQPLVADALAWRSALARAGEFRALGELHYGAEMRAARLAALRSTLAALAQRSDAPWAGLDWQAPALAGYETGAQTALDARAAGLGASLVIAISPPAMAAAGSGPVLLITSDTDRDPLGLLAQAAQRRQAFASLAPGEGWLLTLAGISHAGLAGTLVPEAWALQDAARGEAVAGRRGAVPVQAGPIGPTGPTGPPGGLYRGPPSGSASEAASADLDDAFVASVAALSQRLRGSTLPWPKLKSAVLESR